MTTKNVWFLNLDFIHAAGLCATLWTQIPKELVALDLTVFALVLVCSRFYVLQTSSLEALSNIRDIARVFVNLGYKLKALP
jgi:hypothetical protein